MDYGVAIVDTEGFVSFESGDSPRLLKGLPSLFQHVVMEIVSEQTNRGEGSGLAKALQTTLPGDPNAQSVFAQRVRTAESHIHAFQQDVSLPLDEQLESLQLLSVIAGDAVWEIELLLTSRSGETVRRFFSFPA